VKDSEPIPLVLASARPDDLRELARFLKGTRWVLHHAASYAEAVRALGATLAPVLLCDRDLPGPPWQEAVRGLSAELGRGCVILVSEVSDPYLWDEVIHCGGFDVLARPLREREVAALLDFAYVHTRAS